MHVCSAVCEPPENCHAGKAVHKDHMLQVMQDTAYANVVGNIKESRAVGVVPIEATL